MVSMSSFTPVALSSSRHRSIRRVAAAKGMPVRPRGSSPRMTPASPLMSAERLAELPEAELVILDVRWRLGGPPGRADYDAAHIPGAVFVDLDTELADPPGPGGRHPLPDPARLQARVAPCGRARRHPVVAYDDGNGAVAARAWWLLRWAGMPASRVAVLDGGWAAWVADGRPTTAEHRAARGGRRRRAPRRACPCSTRTTSRRSPAPACCSTRGPRRATAARPSRSTRRRATSRAPATLPATEITGPDGRGTSARRAGRAVRRTGRRRCHAGRRLLRIGRQRGRARARRGARRAALARRPGRAVPRVLVAVVARSRADPSRRVPIRETVPPDEHPCCGGVDTRSSCPTTWATTTRSTLCGST